MLDFAAIDFETANNERSSVCSVGVVIVRNGQIVDKIYRLIRPTPNYYSYFNTRVPIFPDVWKEIAPLIEGLTLVAHNSPFDEGCLKAAYRTYQMDYPDYSFLCTCRASRRAFKNQLSNHQLHTVAAACRYDLTQHHHALADAEACAQIAINIL